MKRKTLTTAVLAGLTGVAGMVSVANAVNVNPDGLGQVLIYPYYTARGGNDTLISVVNTSSAAKAAKIRFLEGLNSREVLDFNLYLSPFDVWTAAITEDGDGARLVTADTSCTVPTITDQPLLPFAFTGDESDGGPTDIGRTKSGYFEVIDMGTLVDSGGGPFDADGDGDFQPLTSADGFLNSTRTAITSDLGARWFSEHIDKTDEDGNFIGREPRDCSALVGYWSSTTSGPFPSAGFGNWIVDPEEDFSGTGAGELFGSASIINVNEGTMFSYNATAIDNWTTTVEHSAPGDLLPQIISGSNQTAAVFRTTGQNVDQRDWGSNRDAVNAVLMQDKVFNEYTTESTLGALTEWVFTFPTKRFHVDPGTSLPQVQPRDVNDIDGDGDVNEIQPDFNDNDNDGNVTEPVTNPDGSFVTVPAPRAPFSVLFDGQACEPVTFEVWDREEFQPSGSVGLIPPIVSPQPPTDPVDPQTFDLCFETNVVRFANVDTEVPAETEILGEPRSITLPLDDRRYAGWAEFNLTPGQQTFDNAGFLDLEKETARELFTDNTFGDGPGTYFGLPVVGFAVTTFTNSTLEVDGQSVLSNYGGTFRHRGSRRIENGQEIDLD